MKIILSTNNQKKKHDGLLDLKGGAWVVQYATARELASYGHDVYCFVNSFDESPEGVMANGYHVIHRKYLEDFLSKNKIDIYIAEREMPIDRHKYNIKLCFYRLHNTALAENPGELKKMLNDGLIDKVIFVSSWHKNLAVKKGLPENQTYVIRNGYDPYPVTGDKKTNRIIWASNPKRGLKVLAEEIFPALKKEMPEMELHVAGGHKIYNFYDADAERKDGESYQCLFKDWKKRIPKDGYVYYGALEQDKLAQFFHEGTLLVYPLTNFSETGSIVVVQSQAYLTPVITKHRCVMPELIGAYEGNFRPEIQRGFCVRNDLPIEGWINSIKYLINNKSDYKAMQDNCKSWRENYQWKNIIKSVNQDFQEWIK